MVMASSAVPNAPMTPSFGSTETSSSFDAMARSEEAKISQLAPDSVLVYLTASPDAIRERMQTEPRPTSRFREEDIEQVSERFANEFGHTLIRRRMTIDTTDASPEQTFAEFLTKMGPHFTTADRIRLLSQPLINAEIAALSGASERS